MRSKQIIGEKTVLSADVEATRDMTICRMIKLAVSVHKAISFHSSKLEIFNTFAERVYREFYLSCNVIKTPFHEI